MKKLPISPLLTSLLASLIIPFAAHSEEEAVWVHDQSDLVPDEKVTWGVLDNGLRYAILPHNEPPNRISLRLYVDAGSLMETDSQQGLAHFLEHMAFNGTENFPAGEMVEYFQRLGMGFGSHTNAHTSFKETVYKLELPTADEDMLDEGFKLLRDYADGMLLGEEEIEKERGVILSEKRSRDSADWRTFVEQIEYSMPDALMSKRLPIGTEEVITNAPREEFVQFYEKWYTPDRMAIVAVGEVTVDQIKELTDKYFEDLAPAGESSEDPDMGTVSERGLTAHYHHEPEASRVSVSIETMRDSTMGPDNTERRALELRLFLANSIINRRLSILAKEEGAPIISGSAYGADLYDLNFVDYASVEATSEPQNWEKALATVEQELRKALEFGFTEAELDEASASILNKYETMARQAPTRRSQDLANMIVDRMGSERVFTDPIKDLPRVTEELESATTEEVLAVYRDFWSDDQDRTVYLSGNVEVEGGPEAILAAVQTSKAVAVEAPAEAETGEFAYAEEMEPGKIADRAEIEDLEITQITFENGVRANFKVTPFEEDTISVKARVGGGLLTMPRDKPGLQTFTSATFDAGGLEAHSADELQRILAGETVGSSFFVDNDAFVFAGRTQPDDLLLQLQLLKASLTAPGYREEAERQFKKGIPQQYQRLKHTPDGVMARELATFLRSGDTRFGYPEQDTMMSYSLEDVQAWIGDALESAYLELSIVGDYDLETAVDLVSRTFGNLPERAAEKGDYAERRQVAFPEEREQKLYEFESEIPKSFAMVYWETDDMSDIKRTRRLGMLASIFRDRLRVKVREELGDAYSPYARNSSSDAFTDYGYFMGMVEAAPDQAQKIVDIMEDIGRSLAEDGISEDELERARKPLVTMIEEYRRTNGYWMDSVLATSQEQPQRLDWARSFVDDYSTITVDEMDELADEYLTPEQALPVIITPK